MRVLLIWSLEMGRWKKVYAKPPAKKYVEERYERPICRVVPPALMLLPDPISWLEHRRTVRLQKMITLVLEKRYKELSEIHENSICKDPYKVI